MIRELTIKNYKSILDHTIELGRINVFIGEKGCGKTNLLEAVAMAAGALTDKLTVEELFNRGMRVAKPSIMHSSFPGATSKKIGIKVVFDSASAGERRKVDLEISAVGRSPAEVRWSDSQKPQQLELLFGEGLEGRAKGRLTIGSLEVSELAEGGHSAGEKPGSLISQRFMATMKRLLGEQRFANFERFMVMEASRSELRDLLGSFGVYDASTTALRGFTVQSRRTPLGIYGETLDVAISQLPAETKDDLVGRARCISWLDELVVDPADELKYKGHKLGKSQSALYFHDKHMRPKNNVFSAENVNEGILHVLFHLTLFSSEGTPKVLGIDNIETALNPQLCRDLMMQLPVLAAKHGKQALITTHNPAILDGLNLHDDEQRLFVVSRNDEGHTRTRRIKIKPRVKGAKYKLSKL